MPSLSGSPSALLVNSALLFHQKQARPRRSLRENLGVQTEGARLWDLEHFSNSGRSDRSLSFHGPRLCRPLCAGVPFTASAAPTWAMEAVGLGAVPSPRTS